MCAKKREDLSSTAPPFPSPFASLAGKRDELPPGPSTAAPAPAPATAAAKVRPGLARAVIRYERKGHGGKEVTVVAQLELPARELERWAKALKQALGCGGSVDRGSIVIQGDQRQRIAAWLTTQGVRKISVG